MVQTASINVTVITITVKKTVLVPRANGAMMTFLVQPVSIVSLKSVAAR